jgi:hypothetical protein
MVYAPQPPYEILRNKLIDFSAMQRLRRFARHWDMVVNSGNFIQAAPFIWKDQDSPFNAFMAWSVWLREEVGRTHSIALVRLAELLFRYLTRDAGHPAAEVANALWVDYQRGGRSDKPAFLRPWISTTQTNPTGQAPKTKLKRQARHGTAVDGLRTLRA